MGVNFYSDLHHDEFVRFMNGFKHSDHGFYVNDEMNEVTGELEHETLEDSLDWREKGAVTPIKDQGQCGTSCKILSKYD